MNLATLPPGVAFLPALARLWRERLADGAQGLAEGLILLPTRRAARGLAAAFLEQAGAAPILLPRIMALGGLDEAPLALAGAMSLPPAIEPAVRLASLSRLILARAGASGAPTGADRAWRLARELALLMDEAERAEIDLRAGLVAAADPAHAEHWQQTLDFLEIVTRAWPEHLAEQGLMNPAARQVALLDAQAQAWREAVPAYGVLAVGNTGDIPAVARLLRVVAGLGRGLVVLPGLDQLLADAVWQTIDDSHPQAGLRSLLTQLGAARDDVERLGEGCSARAGLLRRALLPAPALADWRAPYAGAAEGLQMIAAADPQAEATAIALVLRDALEVPGAIAALVTPDRFVAARVAAALLRFGVVADDSAGEPLAETPPAVFLRLLAACVAERLAPVALLALLKHPLAGAGLAPAALRQAARLLERSCLRGPRPEPGFAGLRRSVDRQAERRAGEPVTEDRLADLLERLERCLAPLLRTMAAVRARTDDLLASLVLSAEALAATDTEAGPARLWALEEGEALAERLAAVQEALPVLPEQAPRCLAGLLDAVLEGEVVRSRRALRGGAAAEHPRVHIWGLLEARLQAADVIVLGGLVEGVWPPATDPGPWLSRAMRVRAGLRSPELAIGQAAHDFCMAACAAPLVVMSAARRREGAPAVPSRWLVRLEAFLKGHALVLPEHPATGWAERLDQPERVCAVAAPRPLPPASHRPRRLAVTEIGTLLADPYAIYARHVLRLRALDPLEQWADFRDYGEIVHSGLHRFIASMGTAWPADAASGLTARLVAGLRAAGLREALIAWWSPRLARMADWIDAQERMRARPERIGTELTGEWVLPAPVSGGWSGAFVLSGRADRLEVSDEGALVIFDYKTGKPPSGAMVEQGLAPQLLLEAAMAAAGAFGAAYALPVGALIYWHLTGGHQPGEVQALFKSDPVVLAEQIERAVESLQNLIGGYADPATPYLSQPHPGRAIRFSEFGQLARVGEWGAAQEEGDDLERASDEA